MLGHAPVPLRHYLFFSHLLFVNMENYYIHFVKRSYKHTNTECDTMRACIAKQHNSETQQKV